MSATKLFLVILIAIIVIESLIMAVLGRFKDFFPSSTITVIDSFLLALFLFPFLYRYLFTPLAQRIRERHDAEIALKESEERYRTVVDNTKEVIFRADRYGSWEFLNAAWTDITGYAVNECLTNNLLNYVHPEDRAKCLKALSQFIEERLDLWRQQVRFLTTNDSYCWIEINARPVKEPSGELTGITGILYDITETRLAGEALQRRDEILQTISFSAELFMRLKKLDISISRVLERIGTISNLKAVFISESNYLEDDSMILNLRYQWFQAGADPECVEKFETIPLGEDRLSRWRHLLEKRESITGFACDFPDEEAEFLQQKKINYIVLIPIFTGAEFWGVMGFEKVGAAPDLSTLESDALKLLANLIGSALELRRSEDILRNIAEGVSAETGDSFFTILTTYLSDMLTVDSAIIAQIDHNHTPTLIANSDENDLQPLLERILPLMHDNGNNLLVIEDIQEAFPKEQVFTQNIITSLIANKLFDSKGELIGFVAILHHKPISNKNLAVTLLKVFAARLAAELERKNAANQLALSNIKLQERKNFIESVVSGIQSGIIVIDTEYMVTLANPYADLVISGGNEDITGKCLSEVCSKLYDSLTEGEDNAELQIRKDVYIGYKCFALKRTDGSLSGHIVAFVDLSEIIKIRNSMRTSERLATMGEVVARVAHEMRNPLFGITAAAQILAMEVQLNPSQKELMDSLFQEAKRMNNLVEELLDCSKEIKLNKKPVDIIKIMNETIGFNEVFLLEKHLTVEKNFPSEIVYNADPERLKQVFLNLFKNSIDASPPGGSINFSLHQDDSNITVSICDAGMGIPENIMEKILDVFFTTKKSGTGLGLYICKKIVDAHGGTLSFANNEPSGVTFSVSLPLE